MKLARKMVTKTEARRKMLAHHFWGPFFMYLRSLMHRKRRLEKMDRRQPLKLWVTLMTSLRSTAKWTH